MKVVLGGVVGALVALLLALLVTALAWFFSRTPRR
jgi:hypothetical protein